MRLAREAAGGRATLVHGARAAQALLRGRHVPALPRALLTVCARDLDDGLDHLRSRFGAGELSAHKVCTLAAETTHLDAAERAEVDRLLAAEGIEGRGVAKLRALARKLAAQVAPGKFRARCAAARTGRRVTLRPAADGMTDLTAHLPAEQGAACYAALQKAFNDVSANPAPLTRSRGQVMADTLIERVTGQTTADDVNVEVQIVVPIEALVDPGSNLPGEIPGHGP
ncbi:MAG: 13E12 repeat family protein, partial [Actinomycetota bacterium]|nr:13E12 repeat family protein [Actinomycetota bacterium]